MTARSGALITHDVAPLVGRSHGQRIGVCIPARDEAATAGAVVPLDGRPDEGGRVNERLARPLLRRLFPALGGIAQPHAGECAVRRSALTDIVHADGYGVEIGLFVDGYLRHGVTAIAEADLGPRVHRHRPLADLQPHDEVLAAVLDRAHHALPHTGDEP